MQKIALLGCLALASACGGTVQARPGLNAAPVATQADMLPARTLRCTLGHALNLDPNKFQSISEIKYEGAHRFTLFLPAIPKHQGPPPDPSADPEPIHPATRIVEDPSGLASDTKGAFARVVDMWPNRVEIASAIEPTLSRLIIVSDIDAKKGTANLFMTRAADAASLDLGNVYQGGCQVQASNAPS